MTGRLLVLAYVAAWRLVRALPLPVARRVFRLAADVGYRRDGKGVRRLRANLARVVPAEDLERVTREGLRSYARYWLEVFRLPVMGRERIVRGMRCPGEERLRDAAVHGGVAVLPHMGNWDVAGAWAVVTGMSFTTVAERLKPEGVFDRFVEFRESLGMEVVPLTGGDANPFDVLADRVRSGRLVCLLGDRDLTARGVEVEFFGETAKFPAGPAALALRTGTPLLPVSLWFDGDGWVVEVGEPVPHTTIREMTQAVATAFEAGIRAHPEDWHMLQRLWVRDLDPARAPA